MTPDRSRIERGNIFERTVAALLGLKLTLGSGNKWRARGDGTGGGIMVECKAESRKDWATIKRQVALAAEEAQGTGDVPVLAVLDDDETAYVVMTLDSFREIRTELAPVVLEERKAEARARRARVPALLRDT